MVDDKVRVRGRVHWLVRRRPKPEKTRSARRPQFASPSQTGELNHAPLARRNLFSRKSAPNLQAPVFRYQPPNAAGNRRARKIEDNKSRRVASPVEPLVRPPQRSGLSTFATDRFFQAVLTPGITRPPTKLRLMTGSVSRVGCMPLLDAPLLESKYINAFIYTAS